MKNIISLMSLLTIVWFSSAIAQEVNSKKIPEKVSAAFAKNYANANDVEWQMEDGNYEAHFSYSNKHLSVQFNDKGEFVQKETYLKVSELPKAVQDYLAKHYAGVKFDEASEVVNAKDVVQYQVETKEKAVIFDSKGNFIKEEQEEEDEKGEDKGY